MRRAPRVSSGWSASHTLQTRRLRGRVVITSTHGEGMTYARRAVRFPMTRIRLPCQSQQRRRAGDREPGQPGFSSRLRDTALPDDRVEVRERPERRPTLRGGGTWPLRTASAKPLRETDSSAHTSLTLKSDEGPTGRDFACDLNASMASPSSASSVGMRAVGSPTCAVIGQALGQREHRPRPALA